MKQNKIIIFGMFLIFTILFSFNVNSAGVSSPYWDENPMYVQPGEIREFSYILQNMVGNEDVQMKAELEGNLGIMQFIDKETTYNVPFGKSDVPVKMKILVPEDAKEGDEWQVGVKFTTISTNTEGKPVTIGAAFSKGFKVIINKPKTNVSGEAIKPLISNQLLGVLILAIVLIMIVFIIKYFYKKRNKQ